MQIERAKILVDQSINPRTSLNQKHVDEFVDMDGNWPPVLVRPIAHAFYTHQLVDGFHRIEAAERLHMGMIEARSEEMSDTEALARALKENLHGQALTSEEKERRCIQLHRLGVTAPDIARITALARRTVDSYLARLRLEEAGGGAHHPASRLPLDHALHLARLVPSPDATNPTPQEQVEAARPYVPVIVEAVVEHNLPRETAAALADTALKAPEHLPALLQKTVEEKLPPESVKHAQQILAAPETPPEVKERILQPGVPIMTSKHIEGAEVERLVEQNIQHIAQERGLPFFSDMRKLREITSTIDLEEISNALKDSDPRMWEVHLLTISYARKWLDAVEGQINTLKRQPLHILQKEREAQ